MATCNMIGRVQTVIGQAGDSENVQMHTLTRLDSTACGVRSFKGKRVFSDYSETVFLIRTGLLRPLPKRKGSCYEFACKAVLSGFGDYLIGVAWGEDEPNIYHAVAKTPALMFGSTPEYLVG